MRPDTSSPTTPGPATETIRIPAKFAGLFRPARYKIMYGGRGGAKSTTVADVLLTMAMERRLRILCARELQRSIKDSVHRLLSDRIRARGLDLSGSGLRGAGPRNAKGATGAAQNPASGPGGEFIITDKSIKAVNGSEFFFVGLRYNAGELKSIEGVDICWVEEGQLVSETSWTYLIPTIRKQGSEIWVTLNPVDDDDATYQRFIVNTPLNCLLFNVNWNDNPWFPDTLDQERRHCLQNDPEAYEWIWNGKTRKIGDAVIFKGKFEIESFDTPANARFLFGADWGFGPDPTVLVRCFEQDDMLYVDYESHAFGLDLNQIAKTWLTAIPGCDKWQIYADCSQPQTINHVKGFGFKIGPALKWPGSVEDGIGFMRGYKRIVVHERCRHTGEEMRLYSYKTDRITDEILPQAADKHNHCIDALRYALSRRIKRRRAGVI